MGSALIVAIAVGCVIAIQVGVVGRAGQHYDLLVVSLVLQIGGLAAGFGWIAARSAWAEAIAVARMWWWIPLGAAGWAIVAGLGFASSRLGVAATLSVAITTQLGVGLAIDGGPTVTFRAITGLVLLVFGTVLITSNH